MYVHVCVCVCLKDAEMVYWCVVLTTVGLRAKRLGKNFKIEVQYCEFGFRLRCVIKKQSLTAQFYNAQEKVMGQFPLFFFTLTHVFPLLVPLSLRLSGTAASMAVYVLNAALYWTAAVVAIIFSLSVKDFFLSNLRRL